MFSLHVTLKLPWEPRKAACACRACVEQLIHDSVNFCLCVHTTGKSMLVKCHVIMAMYVLAMHPAKILNHVRTFG